MEVRTPPMIRDKEEDERGRAGTAFETPAEEQTKALNRLEEALEVDTNEGGPETPHRQQAAMWVMWATSNSGRLRIADQGKRWLGAAPQGGRRASGK